jgi:hypothetical protein
MHKILTIAAVLITSASPAFAQTPIPAQAGTGNPALAFVPQVLAELHQATERFFALVDLGSIQANNQLYRSTVYWMNARFQGMQAKSLSCNQA